MSVKLVDDLETPTARTSHVDRQNNCQDPKSNNRSGDANPLRPFVEYESDADEVGIGLGRGRRDLIPTCYRRLHLADAVREMKPYENGPKKQMMKRTGPHSSILRCGRLTEGRSGTGFAGSGGGGRNVV
jgi:hypothetical protein